MPDSACVKNNKPSKSSAKKLMLVTLFCLYCHLLVYLILMRMVVNAAILMMVKIDSSMRNAIQRLMFTCDVYLLLLLLLFLLLLL